MAPSLTPKILADLRRPFAPAAVKFKIQSTKGRVLVVPFIDARLVIERLNYVGVEWGDRYEEVPGGLRCYLTVNGQTRTDVGEPGDNPQSKKPKALHSDALKRAAVKFGVGVSIYAIPKMYLEGDEINQTANGTYISRKGEAKLRANYKTWLERADHGFGEPIDHGDAEDAAGDHEVADTGAAPPVVRNAPQSLTPRAAERDPDTGMPTAAPVEYPPAPTDARSPREMAVDAFRDWIPKGQSKAAVSERDLIKAGLSELTGTPIADLPGVNGIANMLYGLIGEAIQSRDECAAALSAAISEKQGQS